MTESNSRISVSEDRLRLLFAEFKLELVKELNSYAKAEDVSRWRDNFELRLRKVEDTQTGSTAVSRNQKWLIGLAVVFCSSVVGALLYLATSGVH